MVGRVINGGVNIIDGNTNAVIGTVTVGLEPQGIDVNPMTNRIYVTNSLSGDLTVIQDDD